MEIKSKSDYKMFLEADRISLGLINERPQIIPRNERQVIWKFQRLLRKVEFYNNCKKDTFSKLYLKILRQKHFRLQLKLGFNIPLNVFGPGLSIAHIGTIIINSTAKVGANCRLHVGTNIGMSGKDKKAAILGNDVYLGIGSKIIGNISIANGVVVGANSVVTKSIEEKNITIAGIPAKKISQNGNPMAKERRGYNIVSGLK